MTQTVPPDAIRAQKALLGISNKQLAKQLGITEWQVRMAMGSVAGPSREQAACPQPTITGLTATDTVDYEYAWEQAYAVQDHTDVWRQDRAFQHIDFPVGCGWIGFALFSDMHFGSDGTDYRAIRKDAETVAATDGMFAFYHGDGTDNWILGKMQGLQRDSKIPFSNSLAMHKDWCRLLSDKLKVVVPGNHDLWTKKVAGFEYIREHLGKTEVLYHPFQVDFTLNVGEYAHNFRVRHKWRGSSIYNSTHGIEVGWERGDYDWTFGIGGHTHQGTYCRPFDKLGRRRYAILTGTYKQYDSYGEECGFPKPRNSGCGALLLSEMGEVMFFEDLEVAADILNYKRGKILVQ